MLDQLADMAGKVMEVATPSPGTVLGSWQCATASYQWFGNTNIWNAFTHHGYRTLPYISLGTCSGRQIYNMLFLVLTFFTISGC